MVELAEFLGVSGSHGYFGFFGDEEAGDHGVGAGLLVDVSVVDEGIDVAGPGLDFDEVREGFVKRMDVGDLELVEVLDLCPYDDRGLLDDGLGFGELGGQLSLVDGVLRGLGLERCLFGCLLGFQCGLEGGLLGLALGLLRE